MIQYTLNKLIKVIKTISETHSLIRTTVIGNSHNDIQKDTVYPLLFIKPESLNLKKSIREYKIKLLVLDRIHSDKSNIVEVQSDCLQIMTDIYILLKDQQYELMLDYDQLIQCVADEKNSDWSAGAGIELTIRTNFDYNFCNIPTS